MNNLKILFRGSLAEEKEQEAAAKYFTIIDSRVKVKEGDFIIPRYSVVPFAKEFFEDMDYVGAKTINSYSQYKYIADIKNYVSDLGALTFRTWLASDGFYNLPDNCSFVLKGETNSKKFEWKDMMFAEGKSQITEVYSKLLKDGIIGDQEIYIREYIPLKTFLVSFKGLPITNEYRFFVVNRQKFLNEQYVSCEIEKEILEKDLQKAISAAKATCKNMEKMERDLYLKLNEKEKRIEDLEYLLYECLDGLSKKELISKIKEALK